jgi:uncharacterized HAD superfamily protein
MADRSSDFMLEEYKQIANAYQDLHAQQNELVKFYLTLIAIPASVLAVVAQFINSQSNTFAPMFTSTLNTIALPILLILLFALFLVGCAVVVALVTTRSEAILYVRTVNCVRRYFIEHDAKGDLSKFLALPSVDTFPRYWEGPGSRSFWNVFMVVVMNSAILSISVFTTLVSYFNLEQQLNILISAVILIFALISQSILHWIILANAETNYQVKFNTPYPIERCIGIDLDGVLGDLASEVIKESRRMYNIKIKKESITSHHLEECTALTSDQVKKIFSSGNVFRKMSPIAGAKSAITQLHKAGWRTQILTDRFWGNDDWKIAFSWLETNEFEGEPLDLVRAKDKADYAKAKGIMVFVEDNADTAISLSLVCERVYLLDRTYNQRELPAKVIRISTWQEIVDDLFDYYGQN